MKRKLFTFLVAFLATLSGAVWGQDVLTYEGSINQTIKVPEDFNGIITLENATITADGAAITVPASANPAFVIKGKNKIDTNGGVAIKTPRGTNITAIEFRGGGLLEINSTATNFISVGVVSGECRSLIFHDVTIQTNGKIGGQQAEVTLKNAVIIAEEIPVPAIIRNFSGVVFTEEKTKAGMTASFTLNSPLPEGYVINLNKTLTIGDGQSINKDQVDGNLQNLNAYKVSYLSEFGINTQFPAVSKYWGSNYTVASWTADFEGNKKLYGADGSLTYKQYPDGWYCKKGESYEFHKAGSQQQEVTPKGIVSVEYQAAWYLSEATLNYDTDGYEGKEFPLGYPVNAGITATTDDPDALSKADLQILNENVSSTQKGATAGTHEIELAYNSPLNNAKGQIVVNVEGGNYKITVDHYEQGVYKGCLSGLGYTRADIIRHVVVTNNENKIEDPELNYFYKENSEDTEWKSMDANTRLTNVGVYPIRVELNGQSDVESEFNFRIYPCPISVSVADAKIPVHTVCSVEGEFTLYNVVPGEESLISLEAPAVQCKKTEVGEFPIVYKGLSLKNQTSQDVAKNYL